MSALLPVPEVAATQPNKWRRGKRASMSGSALVARGEPMVWLTGGALAIALFMIVGLLILILVQGIGTFWPVPVVEYQLHDGTRLMGEVAGEETYTLTERAARDSPEPVAQAAMAALRGSDSKQVRRQLVRTGNFDLTGTHFRWVSDFEIEATAEPDWALVVERTSWGRFYGVPKRFDVTHPRPVSGEEEQLQRIVNLVEQNLFRFPDERQQELQAELENVRAEMQAAEQKNAERLLKSLDGKQRSDRQEIELASGETVPRSALKANQSIVAAREIWSGPEASWRQFNAVRDQVRRRTAKIDDLNWEVSGPINGRIEDSRLDMRELELETGAVLVSRAEEIAMLQDQRAELDRVAAETEQLVRQVARRYGAESKLAVAGRQIVEETATELARQKAEPQARIDELNRMLVEAPPEARAAVDAFLEARQTAVDESARLATEVQALREENGRYQLVLLTADGQEKPLALEEIVRAFPANRLDFGDRLAVYGSRWWEFLSDEPREANSEGGVFPAIWGTVVMTLIMSLAVVPFGVLAALYLREYAKAGFIVSAVRIAVNNLAGVSSIVFGVFGLGFFCYIVGTYIDGGPERAGINPWPPATWFLGVGTLAVVAVGAFALGLAGLTRRKAEAPRWKRLASKASFVLWLTATALLVVLIARTPYFDGFFEAKAADGSPTYGKGALVWASLTLALLTLPVVIVATEEALAAVPNSMREGSYACGASKWQTIWRIVLPRAMPGIMTGMILAMARGAGEVAPLMLVGALKIAPELPLDTRFPFIHPDRSFMHLGYHIFDLGFHSPNSEAAKPMVFTTTLLLITLIATLNLAAIWLRARLRRRFRSAQF